MISDHQVETALHRLAETDAEYGGWKSQVLRSEYMAEVAEALAYQQLEGSVEDRKRAAKADETVRAAWDEHFKVVMKFECLRARRQRYVLMIEVWRTEQASARVGNVR